MLPGQSLPPPPGKFSVCMCVCWRQGVCIIVSPLQCCKSLILLLFSCWVATLCNPCSAAHQALLFSTINQSLLIELVMLSNHLITVSNRPSVFPGSMLNLPTWRACFPVSYLFAFSYCSGDSWGKNTGMGCHFLLQWTMFCHNSSLWPSHLVWLCVAWLMTSLSYANPHCHNLVVILEGESI